MALTQAEINKGYKVVSIGALASAVRPRIEPSIEDLLTEDAKALKHARFGGRQVTTKKTRIA
jgi:hypothetical protein